jgi:hypothetical protein
VEVAMKIFRSLNSIQNNRKPLWADIADKFPRDPDCLAAFLAFEAAEVLAGAKPSALINLPDRIRACGKNFYSIWKEHGQDLIKESSLEGKVLVERPGSLLLLLFDRTALRHLLSQKIALAMLKRAGYTEKTDLDSLLSILSSRFEAGSVPHEIGIILGYPLKDVAGFMGLSRREFSCQGPWKIYGNPSESLRLAETHRQCRCSMAGRLLSGCGPHQCLVSSYRRGGLQSQHFFRDFNDNENQIQQEGQAA